VADMPQRNLIRDLLLAPDSMASLTALDWDLLVRQGRRANLLARLAHGLMERRLLDTVPEAPRQHLISAMRVAERQAIAVHWEVQCLLKAFDRASVPLILLKGAAYLLAGLPASKGRLFSDVDVIVPKLLIPRAESALMQHGWQGEKLDAYDQRYYRQWMHEIPPMTHVRRGTTVDLHHSIVPETARVKVDAEALLDGVTPVSGHPGIYVLQPVDMLLHSATHLFREGELENGLRDLFDLDCLLRYLPTVVDGFWDMLVPRAAKLGLARPLHYALRYATLLLGTPVPAQVLAAAKIGRPPTGVAWLMDACYTRGLLPMHASLDGVEVSAARMALYMRSHWIRMPAHLLAYHLGRKGILKLFERRSEVAPKGKHADT
jgi:hypothetical protein